MERKQRYRELATRATPHYRGVPGGGVRMVSSVEEYALRAVDLEREIDKRLERYARLACEIEAQIDRVDDARLRDLLRWRYLNGWAWERVAEAMHYERRQVFRLHNRALRAFAAAALGEGARWP